jgi:hypothetical protein
VPAFAFLLISVTFVSHWIVNQYGSPVAVVPNILTIAWRQVKTATSYFSGSAAPSSSLDGPYRHPMSRTSSLDHVPTAPSPSHPSSSPTSSSSPSPPSPRSSYGHGRLPGRNFPVDLPLTTGVELSLRLSGIKDTFDELWGGYTTAVNVISDNDVSASSASFFKPRMRTWYETSGKVRSHKGWRGSRTLVHAEERNQTNRSRSLTPTSSPPPTDSSLLLGAKEGK